MALPGGFSSFSSREDSICYNITNYEHFLASGKVVNTNSDENPDLWKALRGGSNNLGVVTRFDLRALKRRRFWGGAVYYFPQSFPGQVESLVNELKKTNASSETHIMLSIGYTATYMQLGAALSQVRFAGRKRPRAWSLRRPTCVYPGVHLLAE